ncbi:MAG: flagellar hook basal-body protein [Syntrophales bacterium]|nr:flagellar hook basal-body protein [Syntrophales bacterium]
MIYDVQEIARSCELALRRLDAVTNNLANANTPGFKQEYFHTVARTTVDGVGSPVKATEFTETLAIDYRPGIIQKTGSDLDVAIEGEGFFVVMTETGRAYTRKGDFTLDRDGYLVTPGGDRVQGTGGPLQITGNTIAFATDGTVMVDGAAIGKLAIVKFNDPKALRRGPRGYFATDQPPQEVSAPLIRHGHLEMSNVNVLTEMVNMIDIHRTTETYQKLMNTISDLDKQATSRVGRVV